MQLSLAVRGVSAILPPKVNSVKVSNLDIDLKSVGTPCVLVGYIAECSRFVCANSIYLLIFYCIISSGACTACDSAEFIHTTFQLLGTSVAKLYTRRVKFKICNTQCTNSQWMCLLELRESLGYYPREVTSSIHNKQFFSSKNSVANI